MNLRPVENSPYHPFALEHGCRAEDDDLIGGFDMAMNNPSIYIESINQWPQWLLAMSGHSSRRVQEKATMRVNLSILRSSQTQHRMRTRHAITHHIDRRSRYHVNRGQVIGAVCVACILGNGGAKVWQHQSLFQATILSSIKTAHIQSLLDMCVIKSLYHG
jgi:hypothetical protein